MAQSAEEICNLALTLIGHTKFIVSLTADDSEEADVCSAVFAQDRDEVLSALAWPFAMRHAKPAAIDATTLSLGGVPSGWTYAFALPADVIRLHGLYSGVNELPANQASFALEYDALLQEQIVLTNDDQPEFLYTARVEDVTQFSPLFVRALAGKLGEDLTLGLRKDPKLGQVARAYYMTALGEARADALRGQNLGPWVPAHIAAR